MRLLIMIIKSIELLSLLAPKTRAQTVHLQDEESHAIVFKVHSSPNRRMFGEAARQIGLNLKDPGHMYAHAPSWNTRQRY